MDTLNKTLSTAHASDENTPLVEQPNVSDQFAHYPVSYRILSTVCLALMIFVASIGTNTTGPSLVQLGFLMHQDMAMMMYVFTFWYIGYVIGALFIGVMFDCFNHNMQFFIASFLTGCVCAAAPWIPSIYMFYATIVVWGSLLAYIETGGQPYSLRIWAGHRWKNSLVQLVFSFTTLGYFTAPFIVRPFLVNVSADCWRTTDNSSTPLNDSLCGNTSYEAEVREAETVRYPYAIIGCSLSAISFVHLVPYFKERSLRKLLNSNPNLANSEHISQPESAREESSIPVTDKPHFKHFRLIFLTLNVLMLFLFMWYQITGYFYFPTFVIKYLHWPAKRGALISSLQMGCAALLRLCAIPLSAYISPRNLLICNLFVSTLGYTILLFVKTSIGYYAMWIGTVFVGIGISVFFPTMCLFTSCYIPVTGAVASRLYIATATGGIVAPFVLGYLFQNYTPMAIIYVGLGSTGMSVILFMLINLCIYLGFRK